MRDAGAAWGIALATVGVLAWLALVSAYGPFTVDDTFISLRYAEHVARGIGPTWNEHGPRAEGYTSPLWIAVLATAAWVAPDLELAAKALSVLAALGAIAVTGALAWSLCARREPGERAVAAGLAVLTIGAAPATAIHAVSGMETALAMLLAAGYALAISELLRVSDGAHALGPRCAVAAGLGLALSLTRPEANLVVALTSLLVLAQLPCVARRRFAVAVLALHAVPGALYFAWRVDYYGQLLPLPFYVKAVMPGAVLPGAAEALAFARASWVERIDVGIAVVVAVVALRGRALVLAIPALALWLFWFVPAHEMGYDFRYFQPLLPPLIALAAAGAITIREGTGKAAVMIPAIAIAGSILAPAPWLARSIEEKRGYAAGIARAHAPIGHALGSIRSEVRRPVLASLDAGAIAFHSRWEVIDTWGLNDAIIATRGERDAGYVLAQDPSVVIVISARADRFEPCFEHEQALWDGARALGLAHVASFEFLPDYHLFLLAREGAPESEALIAASQAGASDRSPIARAR